MKNSNVYRVIFKESLHAPVTEVKVAAQTAKMAAVEAIDSCFPSLNVKSYPYSEYGVIYSGHSNKFHSVWHFKIDGFFSYDAVDVLLAK